MINDSETLTGGIHHILYSSRKPGSVLERYEQNQADGELYHLLATFPASPANYIDLHESLRTRWELYLKEKAEMSREWLSPFYILPVEQFSAFHILCDFYSFFIRAECRMIIQVSETWKGDLAFSTLKYELLTLQNELLGLIRETALRLKKHHSGTLKGGLNQFVLKLLQNNLIITFFELQKRSGHLFEENIISKRELFLKHLKQPELKTEPWYRTVTLTACELEEALRTPGITEQLDSVEDLLKKVRAEFSTNNSDIQDSIHLLENAWFCLFIMSKSDVWNTLDLNNPEECPKMIEEVHHQLFQNSYDNDRTSSAEIIQTVIQCFDKVQSVLNTHSVGEGSAAERLIRAIKSHYEGGSELLGGTQPESNRAMAVREVPESTILNRYIPVDDLKDKLGVSHKSMNHYLSKSNTPVHKFSNKTRLIHINDFNTMMDHFKTTL